MLLLFLEYVVPAVAVLAVLIWFIFQVVVVARGPVVLCLRCSGQRIRNAHRRGPERFLPAFISPRRCERCAARFYSLISFDYRLRPVVKKDDEAGPPVPQWKPAFTRSSKEVL